LGVEWESISTGFAFGFMTQRKPKRNESKPAEGNHSRNLLIKQCPSKTTTSDVAMAYACGPDRQLPNVASMLPNGIVSRGKYSRNFTPHHIRITGEELTISDKASAPTDEHPPNSPSG
jgi:hypothetical protein